MSDGEDNRTLGELAMSARLAAQAAQAAPAAQAAQAAQAAALAAPAAQALLQGDADAAAAAADRGAGTNAEVMRTLQELQATCTFLKNRMGDHETTILSLEKDNNRLSSLLAQQEAEASNQLQAPPGLGSNPQLTERFYRLTDIHKLVCGMSGALREASRLWEKLMKDADAPEDMVQDTVLKLDPAKEKCETLLRLLNVEYAAIQAGIASEKDKGVVADRYYTRMKGKALAPTAEDKKLKLETVDLTVQRHIEESMGGGSKRQGDGGAAGGFAGGAGGMRRKWNKPGDAGHK